MNLNNIYAGKRILVTGATGLIGNNLVKRLMAFPKAEVVACGRSAARLETVFHEEIARGLKILEHDVSRPLPDDSGDFDFIFHAASPISGAVIKTEPTSVIASNIRGSENCLEHLRRQKESRGRNGTLVVFSSATVYGGAQDGDRVCREEDTGRGDALSDANAPYSESKRMVEVLASAYHRQFGVGVRIVRFAYVYGNCPKPPKTAFYEFVAKAMRGENMVFNGSGFGRRDNIYVDDAVDGLLTVCERGGDAVPYNVSSNGERGNFAAIDEIAESISRAAAKMGIATRVVLGGDRPRVFGTRLDNTKLKNLGWTLKTSLDEGVFKVLVAAGGRNVP